MSDVVREDAATESGLMTAAEFLLAEGLPVRCDLVKGKVVELNVPSKLHGFLCVEIAFLLRLHARKHNNGVVIANDSGVQTQRDPDSVRGVDVAYCSYERIPKGKLPDDYSGPGPEVIFEVRSKSDRWPATLAKVADYLQSDALVVCVVDPKPEVVRVFRPDGSDLTLTKSDVLEIPEIKPMFTCRVAEIFPDAS